LLSFVQVYDLREFRPGPVLQKIYANLASAIEKGDKMASIVRRYTASKLGVLRYNVNLPVAAVACDCRYHWRRTRQVELTVLCALTTYTGT